MPDGLKRILVLDDDLEFAMYLREKLEDAGYAVFHDVAADSAIRTLEEEKVDAVISDIIIRDGDGTIEPQGGMTLLSYINLKIKPRPVVVALTGSNEKLGLLKHAELLAVDYTAQKPVDLDNLVEELNGLLDQKVPRFGAQ